MFRVSYTVIVTITDIPSNVSRFIYNQGFRPINDGYMTKEERESKQTMEGRGFVITIRTNFLDQKEREVFVEICHNLRSPENSLAKLAEIATDLVSKYPTSSP